jgi:uncharacterized protein
MPPVVTALYGALNALLNIALAYRITRLRDKHDVRLGMGNVQELEVAIRVHANNAEYVPLGLVMLLITELCGGNVTALHGLGGGLLLARLLHAFGLPIPGKNPLRWTGVALTFTMIAASAGYALYLRFSLLHGL